MEEHYAYYVDGHLIRVEREESERNARYFLRLKFITEQTQVGDEMISRFLLYDPDEISTYSRIYADKILLGLSYPSLIEEKLYSMENFENLAIVFGNQLQQAQEIVEDALIFESSPRLMRLEKSIEGEKQKSRIKITTLGENSSFQNETGEEIQNNNSSVIEEVVIEPLRCTRPASVQIEKNNEKVVILHPSPDDEVVIRPEMSEAKFEVPKKEAKFMNSDDEFGFLSIRYRSPIEINDKIFPTALHHFAYELAKYIGNEDLIKLVDEAKDLGKLSRIVEKKLAIDPSIASSDDAIMLSVNTEKFKQNHDLRQKLVEISGNITYVNDTDTYWGKIWGIGPGGSNKLGKILMYVRGSFESPKEPQFVEGLTFEEKEASEKAARKFTIETCRSIVENPMTEEAISETNREVRELNKGILQNKRLLSFSNDVLDRIFNTYDKYLLNGEIRRTVPISLIWDEQKEPAILDDDNDGFRLKLSKNVIAELFLKEGETHKVNGVEVTDQLMVVQKFIEGFIIVILSNKCQGVNEQEFSKALFGHRDFGTASFYPVTLKSPVQPNPKEIREKLLKLLGGGQPKIRLKSGSEETVVAARSVEKALLQSGTRIGYEEITEIL